VFAPLAAVVLLAAAWTAGWSYAASEAEARIAAWRAKEAGVGRVHACGRQTVGGFPFRLEVRCLNAATEFRNIKPPLVVRAKEVLMVAQVYNPTHLVGEVTGPLTVTEPTRLLYTGTWSQAQFSLRGMPATIDRLSITFDGMKLVQPGATVATAERLELHGRIASGSLHADPVLDLGLRAKAAVLPAVAALNEAPADAEAAAVLTGLKTLAQRPVSIILAELQANGGRLELLRSRIQQGDTVALATGTFGLSPSGRPDGMMQITVAGAERLVKVLGFDKVLAQGGGERGVLGIDRMGQVQSALDRIMPGLGGAARVKAAEAGVQMGLALLGEQTQLEGRRAVAIPLRMADGVTTLGPLKLGRAPPLY
jgi:hypothetical protein